MEIIWGEERFNWWKSFVGPGQPDETSLGGPSGAAAYAALEVWGKTLGEEILISGNHLGRKDLIGGNHLGRKDLIVGKQLGLKI